MEQSRSASASVGIAASYLPIKLMKISQADLLPHRIPAGLKLDERAEWRFICGNYNCRSSGPAY